MALDEFLAWFRQEPHPGGFCKATVSASRVSLEVRRLGSSSIIIRMSAIRKLAAEAADNGLIAPELAAGIARVKSAKSVGVRTGNWLSVRQAQNLLNASDTSTLGGLRDRATVMVWAKRVDDGPLISLLFPVPFPQWVTSANRYRVRVENLRCHVRSRSIGC